MHSSLSLPAHLIVLVLHVHLTAIAEEPIPPVALFVLPNASLQKAEQTQSPSEPSRSHPPSSNQHQEEMSASSLAAAETGFVSPASIQAWESMNDLPVLQQILPPAELGGAAGWISENVWEPVFVPEVVKLGKVYVTGGIVTALKRKNLFCLLHPLVFAASW